MSKNVLILGVILAFLVSSQMLNAKEVYFKFDISSIEEIEKLSKIISIDNVQGLEVRAYANDAEWENFERLGYDYTMLPHPGTLIQPRMAAAKEGMRDWDSYPTYDNYISMMYQFADDYPSLCRIVDIGNSEEGRDLLYAVISDNVTIEEDEPEVMYTSTMHGDETTCYPLMLRLIDSLLIAYGTDSLITRLVDSCEIWINPLANPDGTYAGGNNTVYGATRYNANGVDLNRNFPDPEDGAHPDGHSYQAETIAMMNIAMAQNFVISANHHGGEEVINYPWDTWIRRHADDQWYQDISHIFADSAQHYSPSGYLDGFNDGITNGYDWYSIAGGRQDYMNYWHGCREVTMELSVTKLLPASSLPAYWAYLRVSFLDWLENGLYGIRGIITDSTTGLPMVATVGMIGHDEDSSYVYSDPDVGNYHRMIEAGTYDLTFSATGYFTKTVNNVTVTDWEAVRVDVVLQAVPNEPVFEFEDYTADAVHPGDTVSMNLTINNIGGGNAYNTFGQLSTADPWITITQDTSTFPTMTALWGSGTSLTAYEFIIDPACSLFHQVDFRLALSADGGYTDTLDFTFLVGDRVVIYSDNFAFDQGWDGLGGAGEWTIGPAVGGSGSDGSGGPDPSMDNSPTTDNYLLGNDLTGGSGGDYNSGLGTTYWVTSPYIDCSNFHGTELRFYRWLGVESSSYDHAYLEVHNGTGWVRLFENGSSSLNEQTWTEQYYDLATYADSNPDFRFRFGIGPTDGSAEYCGWNIDDIELKGYGTAASGSPDMSYTPSGLDDSLHQGESAIDTIKTYNVGEALLRVRFSSSAAWLSHDQDQHNITEGDSLLIPVTINTAALSPGEYSADIDFTSNDPNLPSGTIAVNLLIYSPDIYLAETSISEIVPTDSVKTHDFVIENNGPGELNFSISRQMFNGKTGAAPGKNNVPLGYRTADAEKDGGTEPFFAPADKNSGGPDDWGYNWIDSDEPDGPTYAWVDISSIGTAVILGDDDSTAAIPIGFDFPFYENFYTSLNIGSNGIVTFGGGSKARTNNPIPNAQAPNNMIALWWDDLDPSSGGNIYYHNLDSERFVVSFVDVPNYKSGGGTGSLNFQAVLYANGKIILQYATMDPGSDYDGLAGATVGIENAAGDDGLLVVYNAEYMHDNLAVQFVAASWLSVDPGAGIIPEFDSDTIVVQFDAAGLAADTYDGQLIINSNDPDSPLLTVPVTMTVTTGESWICGDANGNGILNLLDITYIIAYLYQEGPPPDPLASADVDSSGNVNIVDISYLINYLYMSGPEPNCP
jgi:hypothetical protein